MTFSVQQANEGDQTVLTIRGNVDEDAVFHAPNLAPGSRVTLDTEGVTAINSVGIREWIKWVKAFPAGTTLAVRRCPKIIVDQINMVAGFLPPGTTIESFFVPYFAEESGAEKMVLFTKGQEYGDGDLRAPAEIKDEASGEVMEMDVIEAKYFKFLHG